MRLDENERLIRRTARLTRQRPKEPRDLQFDADTNLLTWTPPARGDKYVTHYRVRMETDSAAPQYQVPVGQNTLQLTEGVGKVYLSSYNQVNDLESPLVPLDIEPGHAVPVGDDLPNQPTAVHAFEKAVARTLDLDRVQYLTVRSEMTVDAGSTADRANIWLSTDDGDSWSDFGLYDFDPSDPAIEFKAKVPATTGTWKTKVTLGNQGAMNAPKYATVSNSFRVEPYGLPVTNNSITATIGTCTTKRTSAGIPYGEIPPLVWTDPPDGNLDFFVRWTVQDYNSAGVATSPEKPHGGTQITHGSHVNGQSLLVTYYTGLDHIKYRCYVANRLSQGDGDFADPSTNTLQDVLFNGATTTAKSYDVAITIPSDVVDTVPLPDQPTAVNAMEKAVARTVDQDRVQYLIVKADCTVDPGNTANSAHLWISLDNEATWWDQGMFPFSPSTHVIEFQMRVPAYLSYWKVRVSLGNSAGENPPSSARVSPLFAVAGYAVPSATTGITATIGTCTTKRRSDGTAYGGIPAIAWNDPPTGNLDNFVRWTVQEYDASGTVALAAEHVHCGTAITNGSHVNGAPLWVTYYTGLGRIRYRCYVANRNSQNTEDFSDTNTNTLQYVVVNSQPAARSYDVVVTVPTDVVNTVPLPSQPSAVYCMEKAVTRTLDPFGTQYLIVQATCTIGLPNNADRAEVWLSRDNGATYIDWGIFPFNPASPVIEFGAPVPNVLSYWKVKVCLGNATGVNAPVTAVVSPTFAISGYAKPGDATGVTATIGTCVTKYASGVAYGEIPPLQWTDPPAGNIDFFVRWTVQDYNAAGTTALSGEKPHCGTQITHGSHVNGSPLQVTYYSGLGRIRYRCYVASPASQNTNDFSDTTNNTLQSVSVNGGALVTFYDVTVTIPTGPIDGTQINTSTWGRGVFVDPSTLKVTVANNFDGNLLVNADWDLGLQGWYKNGGTLALETNPAQSYTPPNCGKLTGDFAGAIQLIAIKPGQRFTLSCQLRSEPTATNAQAYTYYEFHDASGAFIAYDAAYNTGHGYQPNGLLRAPQVNWAFSAVTTAPAPDNAVTMLAMFGWIVPDPVTSGSWYVDNCRVDLLPYTGRGQVIDPLTGYPALGTNNTATSMFLDWDFALSDQGLIRTGITSQWGCGGSAVVRNDNNGYGNYCRLTGVGSNVQQSVAISNQQKANFSFLQRLAPGGTTGQLQMWIFEFDSNHNQIVAPSGGNITINGPGPTSWAAGPGSFFDGTYALPQLAVMTFQIVVLSGGPWDVTKFTGQARF
jgi:hypothetical protein